MPQLACTPDPNVIAPCAKLESGPAVQNEIAGYAEAETIHSVFSELRVEGSVVAPDIRVMAANADYAKCMKRRHEVQEAAARVSNPRAKAGILRTAPSCDSGQPSLAAE